MYTYWRGNLGNKIGNLGNIGGRVEQRCLGGPWFSVNEASNILGYSPRRIRQLLENETLRGEHPPRGVWRIHKSEIDRFRSQAIEKLLVVGEPSAGWYAHNGDRAFYIALDVRSIATLEQRCWASLEVLNQTGSAFPLHWASHPYNISEADPDYADITRDIPARLDVAFAPLTQGHALISGAMTSGQVSIKPFGYAETPSSGAIASGQVKVDPNVKTTIRAK